MSPEISDEARPWLDQSVEDLRAARHLATDPRFQPGSRPSSPTSQPRRRCWNIEGRYPADLGDADEVLAMATIDAADRIVAALRYSTLGRAGA